MFKNKKAQETMMSVLIFAVGTMVFIAMFALIIALTDPPERILRATDFEASASLIAEAVVNSRACLASVGTTEVAGRTVLDHTRAVIEWYDDPSVKEECLTKGPYIWAATIKDFVTGEEKSFGSTCSDDALKRELPVLIDTDDGFNRGAVTVYVDSKDFEGELSELTEDNILSIRNIGTCDSKYVYEDYIVDNEGNDVVHIFTFGDTTKEVKAEYPSGSVENVNILEFEEIPAGCFEAGTYRRKITIWPEGLDSFKKTVYGRHRTITESDIADDPDCVPETETVTMTVPRGKSYDFHKESVSSKGDIKHDGYDPIATAWGKVKPSRGKVFCNTGATVITCLGASDQPNCETLPDSDYSTSAIHVVTDSAFCVRTEEGVKVLVKVKDYYGEFEEFRLEWERPEQWQKVEP